MLWFGREQLLRLLLAAAIGLPAWALQPCCCTTRPAVSQVEAAADAAPAPRVHACCAKRQKPPAHDSVSNAGTKCGEERCRCHALRIGQDVWLASSSGMAAASRADLASPEAGPPTLLPALPAPPVADRSDAASSGSLGGLSVRARLCSLQI